MNLNLPERKILKASSGKVYKSIQRLGSGGNCDVFLVMATTGEHSGILFACKVFRNVDNPDRLDQFKEELDFLTVCDHPGIMQVVDHGEAYFPDVRKKLPFTIAEYYPETLTRVMKQHRLRTPIKLIYILQLLSALKCLESKKVVHRDIKPDNIFIKGYSCVFGDFGLMLDLNKVPEPDASGKLKLSEGAGMPFGYRTPDLVSYAKNEKMLTTKSDTFQLGLVVCELLTGRNPLKACKDKLDSIALEDYVKWIKSNNYSNSIEDLLNRMLTLDPEDRASPEDLIEQFNSVFEAVAHSYQQIENWVL